MADPLTRRALNRATLDRQLLLRRHQLSPLEAVRHLAGLQAQAPQAPYLGLWTRLSGFDPLDVSRQITERSVLRAPVMRATVHMLDAADFVTFRPLFQTLMERGMKASYGRYLSGVDLGELMSLSHGYLARGPLTRAGLGKLLAGRWPDADPLRLAYAATYLVPVVQAPPRGLWRQSGAPAWSAADAWLPPPGDPPPSRDPRLPPSRDAAPVGADPAHAAEQLVLRYLAAFGPASVNDAQTWSGLTRLREVFDRLGARLRVFRGEDGAELFDLPDAPRPGPDAPAPPRFLPEYDNLLLSHADRRRVIPHDRSIPLPPGNGAAAGTVLIDGEWNAVWKLGRDNGAAVVRVNPFIPLTRAAAAAVTGEAMRLLEFLAPGSPCDVRLASGPD